MLVRLATLRDPGTPDEIWMEQHDLTHFPSHSWCKMCVESRRHDSPHREQPKIDAVVLQLQFHNGYMMDGGPLQIACILVGTDTFWSHPRDDGAGLQEDGHALRCRSNSQVGPGYDMEIKETKGFYKCYWTKWQKNVVLKDKTCIFCDKCHRHRAMRAMEHRRKPSPQYVELQEHVLQLSKINSCLLQ